MAIAVMRLRTVAAGVVAPARVLRPARAHRRCPQQVRRRWASTGEADAQTLQQAEAALSRNPELVDTLVEHLSPEIRQRLMMAAVRADHSGVAAAAFTEADLNKDGKLTPEEFQQWMAATASATPKAVSVSRLQTLRTWSRQQTAMTSCPNLGSKSNMRALARLAVSPHTPGRTPRYRVSPHFLATKS